MLECRLSCRTHVFAVDGRRLLKHHSHMFVPLHVGLERDFL